MGIRRTFKAIIERDEDGFFIASVPALPGCHTQAKTLEILRKNLSDVIALCLEEAKENKNYRRAIQASAYEPSFIAIDTVTV